MKYIRKTPEPDNFIHWKLSKQGEINRRMDEGASGDTIFSMLPSKPPHPESSAIVDVAYHKTDLRQALLEEQGYLCCYCNRGLDNNHLTIIEHLHPKGNEATKNLVFDYSNLLACCNGGERDTNKPRETYCTLKKGDLPLEPWFISPLDISCEVAFEVNIEGRITGRHENGKQTIEFLGLNAKSLQLLRKSAIETYLYTLPDDYDIQTEKRHLTTPVKGKYDPFCMAIVSVLQSY